MSEVSALDALLGASIEGIEKSVPIKRLGVDFTVRALTSHEISELQAEATRTEGHGKHKKEYIDNEELGNLMIVTSCVNPDFNDSKLLKHYEAINAIDCLQKALLPGEVVTLSQAVTEVSGYDIDEIAQAKN